MTSASNWKQHWHYLEVLRAMSASRYPIIHVPEGPAAGSVFGSLDDWTRAGIPLGDLERTTMWRIGDWYLLGAKLFGRGACKRIVEAKGWTGPTYAVCRTAASIARRFPEVSRRLDIGFAHHQAVAAVHRIDPEAAYHLLDVAVREVWTQNKIRIEAGRHRSGYYTRIGGDIAASLKELIKAGRRFGAILIDAPWQYDIGSREGLQRGGHGRYYPCMTLNELCALPVEQIATDSTFLFLWCPAALIPAGLACIDAWGFKYQTHGVWKKAGEPGNGYYLRMQHEDWLLGVRPNCKPFRERPNSIIEAPRGAHSEKPSIHQMIEAACDGPYCELFARRPVANWTVCGDQLETSDEAVSSSTGHCS